MSAGPLPSPPVERFVGTPREFHGRQVPEPAVAAVWVHELSAAALVIGSSQPAEHVDADACAAAGLDLVRRRSGGGAVLLRVGEVTWVDVVVPRSSVGDDVHVPMIGVGTAFASALVRSGVDGVEVATVTHRTAWSSVVCFDGLGVGEVSIAGSKAIGISQRRTRDVVRLQCAWYRRIDPDDLRPLLAPAWRPPPGALANVATIDPALDQVLIEAAAAWAVGRATAPSG